jgi:hypothetical protein
MLIPVTQNNLRDRSQRHILGPRPVSGNGA